MKSVKTSFALLLVFLQFSAAYSQPPDREKDKKVLLAQQTDTDTGRQSAAAQVPAPDSDEPPRSLPGNAPSAALRIQSDMQRREAALSELPMNLSSVRTAYKLWNDNRLVGKTYDAEFVNAGISDREMQKILGLQYFHLLKKNFQIVITLLRLQIEQFPMETGNRGNMTMALKFFEVPSPKWQPAVDELMALWDAKNKDYERQRDAAQKKQKEDAMSAATLARQERAAKMPQILAKHHAKIASLKLNQTFLKSRLMINYVGTNVPYRPFEEWVALVLENPDVEDVSGIALKEGNAKGIKVKLKGRPSFGFLFSQDVNELYLTHITDQERAQKLRPGDVVSFGVEMTLLAQDR